MNAVRIERKLNSWGYGIFKKNIEISAASKKSCLYPHNLKFHDAHGNLCKYSNYKPFIVL